MESKKFVIITIILFLVGGMGTFVFATRSDDITPDDINYSKEPTYKKVDTPVIDNKKDDNEENNTNIDNNLTDPVVDDNPSDIITDINNNGNNNSNSSNKKPQNVVVKPVTPKPSEPTIPEEPDKKEEKSTEPETPSSSGGGSSYTPSTPTDRTAPVLTVEYSTTNITRYVTVTIKANEPIRTISGWTLSADKLSLTKTFDKNVNETNITVKDLSGNSSSINYAINNIDSEQPTAIVTTSNNNGHKQTFRPITVTITANEAIQEVDDWTLSADKLSLTKVFKENLTSKLIIKDLVGNESEIEYKVENYNPNAPEVVITKQAGTTTITQTIDDLSKVDNENGSWMLDDETGEYTKVEEIQDDGQVKIILPDGTVRKIEEGQTIITLPDGTIQIVSENDLVETIEGAKILDTSFSVSITVNNYVSKNVYKPTNKAIVTITSNNKELKELEGWDLSEDKKTLTKAYNNNDDDIHMYVYDVEDNSIYVEQNLENINSNYLEIDDDWSSARNGKVKIYTSSPLDPKKLPDGWTSQSSSIIDMIEKPLSQLKKGDNETIEITDIYGNISEIKIEINGTKVTSKPIYQYNGWEKIWHT